MVSEQVGYEGNGKRIGEEVALDKTEAHEKKRKCKIQAYTRVTIPRLTGKKILQYWSGPLIRRVKGSREYGLVESNAHM